LENSGVDGGVELYLHSLMCLRRVDREILIFTIIFYRLFPSISLCTASQNKENALQLTGTHNNFQNPSKVIQRTAAEGQTKDCDVYFSHGGVLEYDPISTDR
jgi:hypothetical protein